MSEQQPTLQNWMTLALLSAVWGSSFILIKKTLISFSSVQVATLRVGISFVVLLPYIIRVYKKIPKNRRLHVFLIGLLGSFLPAFLFSTAQTKIDSAAAGILNSLTPLFAYLWGVFMFSQPKNSRRLFGIIIGLFGAVLLIFNPQAGFSLNAYALFILAATIMYGLSVNIAQFILQDINPKHIAAVSFLHVGIAAIAILFFTDFFTVMQTDEFAWRSLFYVSILAIFGTAIALMLFWKLVQDTDAIFGSMTTYFIPVVAIIWGLADGELLGWQQYVGFALILISVILVKSKVKKSVA